MPLTIPPPFETPRLLVRAVDRDDLAGLMRINGDPEVTRFLPYATWLSIGDASAWYERMLKLQATGTAAQLVLLDKAARTPVGTFLIFKHDESARRAEVGYVLGRTHWGTGLMHEALQAVAAQAFGPLGLRRLEAEVDPVNVASTRVLERAGFVREGLLRQRWLRDQRPYDVAIYGLLAHEAGHAAPGGQSR
jgi:RimJ/RimL family protein N-acetyltransferase